MKKYLAPIIVAWFALFPAMAFAAVGTVFVNTGGATTNSGTTDTASPTFSGTAANWTTGTNTINLDTNTNLTGLSTAGDQAIFLTNATNSNFKIFWITGVTGCTGTGACSVTTSGAPAAPTCTTCTAQVWAIGGQLVWNSAIVEGGLRAGDTVQFDNTPATKAAVFFTARVAGDSTTGPISVIGKAGVRPKLQTTNSSNAIAIGVQPNWRVSNLELVTAGTDALSLSTANNLIVDNILVSSTGGTGACIFGNGAGNFVVTNSELTGCVIGINFNTNNTAPRSYIGNYIHGNTGVGIEEGATSTFPNVTISDNVIAANVGGISIDAASGALTNKLIIEGNTIYGNTTNPQLQIANANTCAYIRNNIIMDTTGTNTIKWTAGNGQLASQHGYNVIWSSNTSTSNVSNYTLSGTEIAADPLMVAPGSGNFAISNSSPAGAAGFMGTLPVAGGSTGSRDIGAIQRLGGSGTSSGHIIGG